MGREIIFTDTIIIFSYERPALYAAVFTLNCLIPLFGLVIGMADVQTFQDRLRISCGGFFLIICSGGLIYLALLNNQKNETGHLATFMTLGIFILVLALLMIYGHFKNKSKQI